MTLSRPDSWPFVVDCVKETRIVGSIDCLLWREICYAPSTELLVCFGRSFWYVPHTELLCRTFGMPLVVSVICCPAVIILFVNLICLESKFDFISQLFFEKVLFSFAFRFVAHTPLLTSQWLIT